MGKFDRQKFASARDTWETPSNIFVPLHTEFGFTLDVCADEQTKKVSRYFSKADNALIQDWGREICWMNPPYGRDIVKWINKAYLSAQQGATVVCLLPSRTNTNWFHDYCLKGELRFVRGRPKFSNATHGLPLPLVIVIFRPTCQDT